MTQREKFSKVLEAMLVLSYSEDHLVLKNGSASFSVSSLVLIPWFSVCLFPVPPPVTFPSLPDPLLPPLQLAS